MRHTAILLVAFLVANRATAAAGPPKSVVRIFLTAKAPPSGDFVEPDEEKQLNDSLKDLRSAFDYDKDSAVEFVKAASDADILLEIMGRSMRRTGAITGFIVPNGFGGFYTASYPKAETVVFVRMIVGDYAKDVVGAHSSRYWKLAAKDAASQIGRWIDANRQQIVAKRTAK